MWALKDDSIKGIICNQGGDDEKTGDRPAKMYCAYFIVLTTDSNV